LKRGERLPRRRRRVVQRPALAETTETMPSDGDATVVDPAVVVVHARVLQYGR
jgi:hypothetical protein